MSRHRRYFVALIAAVVGSSILLLLLTPRSGWVALDQRRSSLRTTPDGVAAWSRSLERFGVWVDARYTSLTQDRPRGSAMVLLEPRIAPTAAEVGELLDWIRGGGVLVYSPQDESLLFDSLGLLVSDVADFDWDDDVEGGLLPHRWTNGVEGDADLNAWIIEVDPFRSVQWSPLAVGVDPAAATLAWVPVGSGGVLAIAEAEVLSNGFLGSTTLSVVAARALVDLVEPGDTVFFSEYHQGLDGRRGIVRESFAIASSTALGRAAIHLAVVAVLLLIVAGGTFGAPVPEQEVRRRSPLEHVDALGRIYEISASERSVASRLVRGAARRMGARSSEGDEQILEGWRERPDLRASADLALQALRQDPPNLPALAAALDQALATHTARNL